jgi:hypothetical protein
MKIRRKYDKAAVVEVGKLYMHGIPMAQISVLKQIPYKTVCYWIKGLRKAGLSKPPEEFMDKTKFQFRDMANQLKDEVYTSRD